MVTISPSDTNRGTFIIAPVESVAGFVPPVAVSPFTPGSVCVIFRSTKVGPTTDIGFSFQKRTLQISSSVTHFSRSETISRAYWNLFICVGMHKKPSTSITI